MTEAITASQIGDIAARLQTIEQRMLAATPQHRVKKVRLVAVTKTFPVSTLRAAYAAGIRDFAENKVQEGLGKQAELSDLTDVTWHFIGRVQSNKSRSG